MASINGFLLVFLALSGYAFLRGTASLGINYGQVGNNLPAPETVLHLLASVKLTKVRIYDTNPQILSAFSNSSVELIVTVENQMLSTLANPQKAFQWVNARIMPFIPATRITGIAVGNEVFSGGEAAFLGDLMPAIVSIHGALTQLGVDKLIQVSTPNSLAVLASSYPPSSGAFKNEVSTIMLQLLNFLSRTNSPFWINAYPYFAYKDSPNEVSLDYVLLNKNAGMIDPYTKLPYDNMLYAQVDAVTFAIARMGFYNIEVRVSETGWPSRGDPEEVGATVENAAVYSRNLLRRQLDNEGTPLRPNSKLDVYLFALFNEDMKSGPTSERNYGLYQPNCTMVYNVGLAALSSSSSSTSSASVAIPSAATKDKRLGLLSWACLTLLTFRALGR